MLHIAGNEVFLGHLTRIVWVKSPTSTVLCIDSHFL